MTDQTIRVESFGAVYGPPATATLTVDLMNLMYNPHDEPRLKNLTGLDAAIVEHVMTTPGAAAFRDALTATALAMARALMGDRELRISIGCKAGRHRSVAMACHVASALQESGFEVELTHRDILRRKEEYRAAERGAAVRPA